MPRPRIFLLSPATAHGAKGKTLLEAEPRTPAARRFREEGMAVGDVFRYLSGLYFNGKLTYARTLGAPPSGLEGMEALVISMTDGLLAPEMPVGPEELRRYAAAERGSEAGRRALEEDARALASEVGDECDVVLLGALATGKYTDALLPVFGERLLYPRALLGLGQLDRGALLFRCVRAGTELDYAPVAAIDARG
jgi:hypothetical protein